MIEQKEKREDDNSPSRRDDGSITVTQLSLAGFVATMSCFRFTGQKNI